MPRPVRTAIKPTSPPASPDVFEIDAGLLDGSSAGLELLRYLARCALGADQVGFIQGRHQRHHFPGALGLAPAWKDRALTRTEQRWVSACIAAHSNHFGIEVPISVRAGHPALQPLEPGEAKRFSLFEGAFFGNLFRPDVGLFACTSGESLEDFPVGKLRVCTQAVGDGEVTRCGFRFAGQCAEAAAVQSTAFGDFEEVIAVYLDPGYRP